jgi:AraC-like DNA-binding protein
VQSILASLPRLVEDRASFDALEVRRLVGGPSLVADVSGRGIPYAAVYCRNGSAIITSTGVRLEIRAGMVAVFASAVPLSVESSEGTELLILRMPAELVGPFDTSLRLAHGRSWATQEGTASLVGRLLDGLAAGLHGFEQANQQRLASLLIGMISLMCADSDTQPRSFRDSLLERSKVYVEDHLADPELTPDRIALAHNVSTRTLHRLFESDGQTIGSWIRTRRLEKCRVELLDATLADIPVSAIGSRWGLCDAAHFSRLFKAAFGHSPRSYRGQNLLWRSENALRESTIDMEKATA